MKGRIWMENELEHMLKKEHKSIVVPKRAIYRAINQGIKRGNAKANQRNVFIRAVTVAIVCLIALGAGVSGVAEDFFDQVVHLMKVERFYNGISVQPENNQQAKEFIMKNGIGYWATGEKSEEAQAGANDVPVQPGFYDVTLVEGKIGEVMGQVLLPGETYHNYWLGAGNFVEANGDNVAFRFSPARFNSLEKVGNQYVLDNYFGEFEIGKLVEPGVYQVEVIDASSYSEGWRIYVRTENTLTNKDGVSSQLTFSNKEFGNQALELKKGSLLTISRAYVSISEDGSEKGVQFATNPPAVKVILKKVGEEAVEQ